MTTNTIGSASRAYATPQLWMDDCPASLVTAAVTWEGECYNDSEFVAPSSLYPYVEITGTTADATYNVSLRCASGESFKDHANAATNALKYNVSNGVGFRKTSNYSSLIKNSEFYTTIEGLQLEHTGAAGSSYGIYSRPGYAVTRSVVIRNCITEGGSAGMYISNGATVVNCLAISSRAAANGFYIQTGSQTKFINCTAVCPTDITSTADGFRQKYNQNHVVQGCASFGFSTSFNSNWNEAGDTHNAGDDANVPGSSPQSSLTYADQFEDNSDSRGDWRPKSGNGLDGNCTQFSETSDLDIIGQARDVSTPDIGCWEYTAPAGGATGRKNPMGWPLAGPMAGPMGRAV